MACGANWKLTFGNTRQSSEWCSHCVARILFPLARLTPTPLPPFLIKETKTKLTSLFSQGRPTLNYIWSKNQSIIRFGLFPGITSASDLRFSLARQLQDIRFNLAGGWALKENPVVAPVSSFSPLSLMIYISRQLDWRELRDLEVGNRNPPTNPQLWNVLHVCSVLFFFFSEIVKTETNDWQGLFFSIFWR